MATNAPELASHNAPGSGGVVVSPARWPEDTTEIAVLLAEFHAYLCTDHGQDFPIIMEEAAALPGPYAAPGGAMLLAWVEDELAGCFALKAWNGTTAEAKRMFIRPAFRGRGLGHHLVGAVLTNARCQGYRAIRLDSLHTLPHAHRLYEKHGFADIPPYKDHPSDLVRHMECPLA